MKPLVAAVAVLVALAVGAQAQTPEIDALRVRAEQGDVEAQNALGFRYRTGRGVPQDDDEHTDERLVHDSTPSPVGHRRVGDGA